MDRAKVIAGSVLGVGVLVGVIVLANQHRSEGVEALPPQARLYTSAPSSAVPQSTQIVPKSTVPQSVATSPTTAAPYYSSVAPGVGTVALPASRVGAPVQGALVPQYDYGIRTPGSQPIGATVVPANETTVVTTKTAMVQPTHVTYHRVYVSKHRHEKPGNIHVARGLKHTIAFSAKLPFRLRM